MRETFPSAIAEAGYQVRRAGRTPEPVTGPGGIAIPPARAAFRRRVDGPLLSQIVAATARACRDEDLPATLIASTAEQLAADLVRLYPPTDMATLRRYGFAHSISRVAVEFEPHDRTEWLEMAEPVVVPTTRVNYLMSLPGGRPRLGLELPDDARPFFLRVLCVRAVVRDEIQAAINEPGQFAAREKRMPTWGEIGAAWPRVGAWMQAQREAVR